jgi:protein-S-isoprenylcysteine O-methyltransferase Ste14
MSFVRKRLTPRLLLLYAMAAALIWTARPTPLALALGLLPIALGEGLRLWATGHLHKNDALTVSGPYAYLRHPLYLGTLLIGSGFAIMAGSAIAAALWAVFVLGYFAYYMPYKNRIETARLEAAYGDAFRRYAVAVPTLLPRLHPYRPLGGERAATQDWRPERFADNHEAGTAVVVGVGAAALVARWAIA